MGNATTGHVYLIGAGPGAPDLLTVRAVRLLQAADVVLYDRLVSAEILALAPELAEFIYTGKDEGHQEEIQAEINRLLMEHALRGRTVVRLKGGDPFLFGRGAEEMRLLRDGAELRLRPQARVLAWSLVVGVIAGVGAIVFFAACQVVAHFTLDAIAGYRPGEPGGESPLFNPTGQAFRPWLLLIVPTVGGLVSGWIVYTFAPEAEGHGTDSAIAAYHYHQGLIRPRVPLVKTLASAVTLGTGGSGGREGPIAQIGAGFGSFLGGVLRLRPALRTRRL